MVKSVAIGLVSRRGEQKARDTYRNRHDHDEDFIWLGLSIL